MEFFISANFAFGCFAGLGPGNGLMIENFGSQALRDLFCAKMYDGTWGGAGSGQSQRAVMPPSTTISVPVTKRASSEAR